MLLLWDCFAVTKPLSQIQKSTLWPLQDANPTPSLGGFGIRRDEALLRVEPQQIYQLLLPRFEDKAKDEARSDGRLLTKGLGTSPGAATGEVVFDADTATERGAEGASVILARTETSPDDVHGMVASAGILTSRGGATSHAAVVATGMGKPCITAAESIEIDSEKGLLRCGDILSRGR